MRTNISHIEDVMTPEILSRAKEQTRKLSSIEQEHWRQAISWFFLTDIIKTKIRTEIQRQMKKHDFGTLILSILLIFTQFFQLFFYLNFTKIIDTEKGIISVQMIGESSILIESLRTISSLGSVSLLGLTVFHYILKKNLLIFKQQYEINSSYKSTRLLMPLIFELFLSVIHTPPFLNNILISLRIFETHSKNIPIDINIIISLLSEFRFYFIVKFYFNYSRWGNDLAVRICRESNVSHDMLFVLKAELKDHPFILICIIFFLSSIIFGYSLSLCEMCLIQDVPLRMFNDWTNIFNGLWCILTSMISLGYGDFNPRTIVGRVIIILSPIWGLTITSYFFLSLISSSLMSSKEFKVYKEISNEKYRKVIKEKSLNTILNYYRLHRIMQFDTDETIGLLKEMNEKKRKGIYNLNKAIKDYKMAKRQLEKYESELTTEDLLDLINREIKERFNVLVYTSKTEINNLIQRIDISKEFQERIQKYIKALLYMNKNILIHLDSKDKDSFNSKINNKKRNENDKSSLFKVI